MLEIHQIPVLEDNYIYLLHDSEHTAAVDPALAEPVLALLEQKNWALTHILNTHHHWDHVGANLALQERTGCVVVGAKNDRARIPGIDLVVEEGDHIPLGTASAQVLEVPGHTRGHIAYWFSEANALFCGDTLFSMGCGRLFEGSAEEMWRSLSRLAQLPAATRVYCAHEYTESNGRFALSIDSDNPTLQQRMKQVRELRQQGLPTVPSTLAQEKETNPFLRAGVASIQQRLAMTGQPAAKVFAELRRRKDRFG